MLYTSYYANRSLTKDIIPISISNSIPEWYDIQYKWNIVVPNWNVLVKPHKSGELTNSEYRDIYLEYLNDDKAVILTQLTGFINHVSAGKDIVFLCYESPDKFCHRHILADWIRDNSEYYIKEYGY